MMKKSIGVFICGIFLAGLFACSKPGPGGDAAVDLTVRNDSSNKFMDSASVWIKYGAAEVSGTDEGSFDLSKTTTQKGRVVFSNLTNGNYFFYSEKVVTDTSGNSTTFSGGIHIKIANKGQVVDTTLRLK